MNKKFLIFPLIAALFLSGCTNRSFGATETNDDAQTETNDGEDIDIQSSNDSYIYERYKNGIKLLKYIGEYKEFIEIPKTINSLRVVAIGNGCFKRVKVNVNRSIRLDGDEGEETDNGDPSTYYIPEDVDDIEDGSFDEDSTFVTPNEQEGDGWEDSAITGSAVDGEGNVYFDTGIEDTVIENGIVYTYIEKVDGYYVARCLSQAEEIDIPDKCNDIKVVQIGRRSFYKNQYIKSVNFPNSITDIYPNSFEDCNSLANLSFNSPYLSKITVEAFKNCESLDVVVLPDNCAVLGTKSFSGCGTISAIHIPAAMTELYPDAFENTIVKKVYYYGNEEQWNTLITARNRTIDDYYGIKDAEVVFFGSNEVITLESSLDVFPNLPTGTQAIIKGVLAGYVKGDNYLLISELSTGFSIVCYHMSSKFLYEPDKIGRQIVATGTKMNYYGMAELNNAVVEFTEDTTIYNVPKKNVDWTNPETSVTENLYYFSEIVGTVNKVSTLFAYFEDIDKFYAWGNKADDCWVGKRVKFTGLLVRYGVDYEFIYDKNLVQIIEE